MAGTTTVSSSPSAAEEKAFTKSKEEILKHFDVTEQRGLSSSGVDVQRSKFGKNGENQVQRISWVEHI